MARGGFAALMALAPLAAGHAQVAPTAPVPDFSAATIAIGTWSYQPVAGGSSARFTDSGGTGRVTLQCNRATRRVTLAHTSAAPATSLFVWTSSLSRTLAARFEANAMRVAAEVPAMDPLLDAIAFSRGRFAMQLAGVPAQVVPVSPEAARVIEDCRT